MAQFNARTPSSQQKREPTVMLPSIKRHVIIMRYRTEQVMVSLSTPFQVDKFWSLATPGKTLCLLDGTYESLVTPETFAGTAEHPITIRALNDGEVLIDGGSGKGAYLKGSYGILEGVNVKGGSWASTPNGSTRRQTSI